MRRQAAPRMVLRVFDDCGHDRWFAEDAIADAVAYAATLAKTTPHGIAVPPLLHWYGLVLRWLAQGLDGHL
jgi:hypothetical protein